MVVCVSQWDTVFTASVLLDSPDDGAKLILMNAHPNHVTMQVLASICLKDIGKFVCEEVYRGTVGVFE